MAGFSCTTIVLLIIFSFSTSFAENAKNDESIRGLFGSAALGIQEARACICKCGVTEPGWRPGDRLRPKFLGGVRAEPHSLPWLALVFWQGKAVAGGALISDRHVITAASPLFIATAIDVKVSLGAHDRCIRDDSNNASVVSIVLHPQFDIVTKAHDLALLKLTTFVNFNRNIRPICLPPAVWPYDGEAVVVAGWMNDTAATCSLKTLGLAIVPDAQCIANLTSPALLTEDKDCLASSGLICEVDAGVPVQHRSLARKYTLLGVIPAGNVCNATINALFVKIQPHLTWIKQQTFGDCLCGKI